MIKEILADCDLRQKQSVEVLRQELTRIRTGKASAGLVEPVKVDAYGSEMPLSQVATVTTPDARTILIQPWDKSTLGAVEKAIQKSDLGLNPNNDGQVIRLTLPPLNEERRKELVKIVKKYVEDAKTAARNVRRDANDHIKKLEKAHDISEDQSRDAHDEVQKLTDKHIKEMDHLFELKEKEVMEI
ncbi:MAG: ribosome recycling factor [Calditrichaeota bacterium]|nr:ribosome recycling factor [Calditrichota bacterium]MCB9366391.1 ribosome recycling factor [Calditrichota bacterium]MCB9391979.1 ribosome recycling factor [Calditrichota bacterium]